MSPDVIAAGVFGIAGAVVGAVVGLFGERLLQRMGEVQCMIEEDGWRVERGRGGAVEERRLRVAFLNSKEVPVTLWDVSVEFSKGGEPLAKCARPHVDLVNPDGFISEIGLVTLPPHILVPLEIRVVPEGRVQGTDQERAAKLRALGETDSAKFVATLILTRDKRRKLEENLEEPWLGEAEA